MGEKDLRPIEREIIEAYRALDIFGRGDLYVKIDPDAVNIESKRRWRIERYKK